MEFRQRISDLMISGDNLILQIRIDESSCHFGGCFFLEPLAMLSG